MNTPNPTQEEFLKKASQGVYKQNFELSIRNKTLSILKILYDISVSTLDPKEVAQKMVDSLSTQLHFPAAFISAVDETTQSLVPLGISQSAEMTQALQLIGKPLEQISIPLTYTHNLLVNVANSNFRQITSNLLDILDPLVTQDIADQISKITQIKIVVIYPLSLGPRVIGVLALGVAKKIDDLSRLERETIEQLITIVSIALDRAQLHQELKRANEKLKEVDQLKDEFVSLASHELRTPMTAIKSYTWMVLNAKAGEISPTAKDYLNKVFLSTERLIRLVSEMLDISRIESGRVQLKIEPFDLTQLLVDIKEEFMAKALESKLSLDVALPPNPVQVVADREKMHQVLENLVGNAFKFTPAGGKVTISTKPFPNLVEVAVTDTGRGIAESNMSKLFHKFGRLEREKSMEAVSNGTGLGLYICRQYVEMCHGQISVISNPGVGSTFIFTIPTG